MEKRAACQTSQDGALSLLPKTEHDAKPSRIGSRVEIPTIARYTTELPDSRVTGIGMGNCRRPDIDWPQLNESQAAAWVHKIDVREV